MIKSSNDLAPLGRVRWFVDFDQPEMIDVADLPPPEPTFSQDDIAAARMEAWNDGYLTGSGSSVRSLANEQTEFFADLSARSEEMERVVNRIAEQSADTVARWLGQAFAAAFPSLPQATEQDQLRRVAELLRPLLQAEAMLEVRGGSAPPASCESIQDVWRQVEQRWAEGPSAGAITIAWPRGEARIDPQQTWQDIRSVLLSLPASNQDETFELTIGKREVADNA